MSDGDIGGTVMSISIVKSCEECGDEHSGLYENICDHCAAIEDEWGGGCDQ